MHKVDILCIDKICTSHGLGERICLAWCGDYVNMICHQTVSIYSHSELLRLFFEKPQEYYPVLINEEDILPVITTLGNMVWDSGDNDSCIP